MSGYKEKSFNERIQSAQAAKKASLEKFKAKPAADDPAVLARQAALKEIAENRARREAERKIAREEQAKRDAEEKARLEAERLVAEAEAAAAAEALVIAQKAARDARYAARKARK
jgi:hypothetical protein